MGRHQNLILVLILVGLGIGASALMPMLAVQAQPEQTSQPSGEVTSPAPAEVKPTFEELKGRVEGLSLELERIQKTMARLNGDENALQNVEAEVGALRTRIAETLGALNPLRPQIEAQIEQLGPAPQNGERQESSEVARERADLNTRLTELEGATKRLNLTDERAAQLLSQARSLRRQLLAQNLLRQSPGPLLTTLQEGLTTQGAVAVNQLRTAMMTWIQQLAASPLVSSLIFIFAALAYGAAIAVRQRWLPGWLHSTDTSTEDQPVSFFKRAKVATFVAPVFAAPRLIAAGLLATLIAAFGLVNWQINPILIAVLFVFSVYTAVSALTRAVLLPEHPGLRLVGVDTASARRIGSMVLLLVAVWSLDYCVAAASSALNFPEPVNVTAALLVNLAFSVILIILITTPVNHTDATHGGQLLGSILGWLKVPAYLAAVVVVVASLLGYLALGRFIMGQVLLVGIGGFAVFLVSRAIAALTDTDSSEPIALDGDSDRSWVKALRGPRVAKTLRWVLMGLLLAASVPILLLSWGFSGTDLATWAGTLVFGFEVGGVRISPARIALAISIFALLILITRLAQQWARSSLLAPTRVDTGLAHSVHQFLGYAGVGVAALAAVSYAGLDITNIAIVAGALSVGIGFGLQSIVNNFVSGLILLVERPIKVGDWIVVGEYQGHVRRISVRSTEIETFDRASLILPNSELITGTVQNWTHRNTMGRIVLPVGASYSSDPAHVISVLERVAHESENVLRHPPPLVTFEGLGASSLDFALRAYIPNVNNMLASKTDLLVRIVEAFRREAIEIPFPQQDIHLRDLDGIRSALAKAALARVQQSVGDVDTSAENVSEATEPRSGTNVTDFKTGGRSANS